MPSLIDKNRSLGIQQGVTLPLIKWHHQQDIPFQVLRDSHPANLLVSSESGRSERVRTDELRFFSKTCSRMV